MRAAGVLEHVDDGTAIRLLDDEADFSERAVAHDHLARCPACRSTVEALAFYSHEVRAMLVAAAPAVMQFMPPPPARPASSRVHSGWPQPLLLVVVTGVMLLGIVVSAGGGAVTGRTGRTPPSRGDAGTSPLQPVLALASGDAALTVDVDAPRGGSLVLRSGRADSLHVRVMAPERHLVDADAAAIRLQARTAHPVRYEITLPLRLRQLEVTFGGVPLLNLSGGELARRRRALVVRLPAPGRWNPPPYPAGTAGVQQ